MNVMLPSCFPPLLEWPRAERAPLQKTPEVLPWLSYPSHMRFKIQPMTAECQTAKDGRWPWALEPKIATTKSEK